MPEHSNADRLMRDAVRMARLHILPLVMVAFLFTYLDKVNISFAALRMNADLGLSNAQFGTAVGIFAFGYALFSIPSTLALHRYGARRTLTTMLALTGFCSGATAFVSGSTELCALRFLLGAAESGFAPGVILFLSGWFPTAYRGVTLSAFFAIGPLGLVIGGPLSTMLLGLDGVGGLAGWRWLFIVEALPPLCLSLVLLAFLRDTPRDASWLSADRRAALMSALDAERSTIESERANAPRRLLVWEPRMWLLAATYLGMGASGIGAMFFLPLMVRSTGFGDQATGFMVALPAIAAGLCLPLWGRWTDRTPVRERVVAVAAIAIATGLTGAAIALPSPVALAPLSLAMIGFFGFMAAFWTLPSAFLTGSAAAFGIALINLTGNLGNFVGPVLFGRIADGPGGYPAALITLALLALVPAAIMIAQSARGSRVHAAGDGL